MSDTSPCNCRHHLDLFGSDDTHARPVDLLLIDFPRHIQALRKHFQPAADSKNAVEEIGDAVQP